MSCRREILLFVFWNTQCRQYGFYISVCVFIYCNISVCVFIYCYITDVFIFNCSSNDFKSWCQQTSCLDLIRSIIWIVSDFKLNTNIFCHKFKLTLFAWVAWLSSWSGFSGRSYKIINDMKYIFVFCLQKRTIGQLNHKLKSFIPHDHRNLVFEVLNRKLIHIILKDINWQWLILLILYLTFDSFTAVFPNE